MPSVDRYHPATHMHHRRFFSVSLCLRARHPRRRVLVSASAKELRAVRYRFQGRERSAATGLASFRMRWYDPATGRWLSKDPIGLSGGLNLYAFCGGNPLNDMDPYGLEKESQTSPFGRGVQGFGAATTFIGGLTIAVTAQLPPVPPVVTVVGMATGAALVGIGAAITVIGGVWGL